MRPDPHISNLVTETLDGTGAASFTHIHDPFAGERRIYQLATP